MPISKKNRFEIFKRDKFSCQYCGRTPPDVTLEIDHIIPLSKDGTNDPINLITSCWDCNRGKGCRLIETKIVRNDTAKINKELKEQVRQMEEYYSLKKKISLQKEESLKRVLDYWYQYASGYLSTDMEISFKRFLNDFEAEEIIEAIGISVSRVRGWQNRIKYTFGILHNWKRKRKCQE